MSRISTLPDTFDPVLSSKVREIIEGQWGKCMADVQNLSVGRFYERLLRDGEHVSYRPTNRYILRVRFFYARDQRRILFTLN